MVVTFHPRVVNQWPMVYILGLFVALALPTHAQTIIPDATTPTTLNGGTTSCSGSCTITGGIQAAGNLFHSFEQFSVDSGAAVTFVDPGVQNILTRVTGDDRSFIDGKLSISGGNANLFLLNPNGISFGDGASLELGGSFVASTANAIALEDGSFGISDASATNSVLTINVPTGLQIGANPGEITVNGAGNKLFLSPNRAINRPLLVPDLELSQQTLALVGGAVTLDGAVLSATDGRVEIGSVRDGLVTLAPDAQGFHLSYDGVTILDDINLVNAALLDVSGPSVGNVQLQGKTISLSDGSAILAGTLGSGQGGEVKIDAEQLSLSGAASFVPDFIPPQFAQFVVMPSGIFASVEPEASGNGSEINIRTEELTLSGGAQVAAATFSTGNAGALNIVANSVTATGGLPAGPTGLFTTVSAGSNGGPGGAAPGNGGDLTITTKTLSLTNGAQVSAGSFGFGNAGNLTVNSQLIEVTGSFGEPPNGGPSSIRSASERPWAGDGGHIAINTEHLLVADGGQVVTGTLSNGDAGDLRVQADQVELRGGDAFGQSGLLSSTVDFQASGNGSQGGSIVVEASRLSISDGATISVSNLPSGSNPSITPGQGPVGNVTIAADQLQISNESNITTASAGGEDGNILINAGLIALRHNALITADASGTATGGNIAIATNFLVAPADENSDITANAENNFGGNIQITTQGLFGIHPRSQSSLESDITASSGLGIEAAGEIVVNNLAIDPAQGITELPTVVATEAQVQAACSPTKAAGVAGSFTHSGRGGLPAVANHTLRSASLWQDIQPLEEANPVSGTALETKAQKPFTPQIQTISESQAWEYDAHGNIQLVAYPSNQNTHSSPNIASATTGNCLQQKG